MSDTMYPEERISLLSSFVQKLQLKQGVKSVNFIVIHSAAFDTTQKMWWFLAFRAAIIFRCYYNYTLIQLNLKINEMPFFHYSLAEPLKLL